MTCIVDTPSVNLTVLSGQLSADLVVDPGAGIAPNPLVVNPAGVYVIGSDGWIPLPTTLAFSSADGHTFVATTSADLRSFIGLGDKIRLVQSGVPAYFFVTAITAGQITLYGGTLYTLAALPVTLPYFSKAKSPSGFTLNPVSWTEEFQSNSQAIQLTSTPGTWYNPGSQFLDVPIGVWDVSYQASPQNSFSGAAQAIDLTTALSTTNNGATDLQLLAWLKGANIVVMAGTVSRRKFLAPTVKTRYFLNIESGQSTNLSFEGAQSATLIRATTVYL